MSRKNIRIPDLRKFSRAIGVVHPDFNIREALQTLVPRLRPRYLASPDDLTHRLFLGHYDLETAIYRRDFLSEWLDNKKTRQELNALLRALPRAGLSHVREFPDGSNDGWDEWDEDLEPEGTHPHREFILQQIREVRKYLSFPETFEMMGRFSGQSMAGRELAEFGQEARKKLEPFARATVKLKKQPQFSDKSCIDVEWANQCLEETSGYHFLLSELRPIRPQLAYYRRLSEPFEATFKGKRIPICKPEFLDPEMREGHIRSAHNPSFFQFEHENNGRRRVRYISKLSVPNDVDWDMRHRHTYVYGPNNMGKSVYLSTAALNIHLAMNGSYCFADSCELSLPRKLHPCFDMGDTTNAGHFVTGAEKIRKMLRTVRLEDIVFLDEHGGGAEPDQERKIAKGITYALVKHQLTFFYATNDRDSWNHRSGGPRSIVLSVPDYNHMKQRGQVRPGIAKAGYSMVKAKQLGIDPDSAMRTLKRRL